LHVATNSIETLNVMKDSIACICHCCDAR